MNTILVLVLAYNIIVIGGIGKYLSWRTSQQQQVTDMALGGRNAGVAMFSVTIAITYLGSAHVYGLMEMSFSLGGCGALVLLRTYHTIMRDLLRYRALDSSNRHGHYP